MIRSLWLVLVGSVALLFVGFCTLQRHDALPDGVNVAYDSAHQRPYTKSESDSILDTRGKREPEMAVLGTLFMIIGGIGLGVGIFQSVHKPTNDV